MEEFSDYVKWIEQEIAALWNDLKIRPLKDAVKYLLPFGKRVRSVLALLAHEAVGGNYENVLELVAVIEGLHAASLIQDDIIDNSSVRRGVESVHVKFGLPIAILASDYLIFKSYDILIKTCQKLNIPEKITLNLVHAMSNALIDCTIGESLELGRTGFNTSIDEYIEIIELKTARQFETSAFIGATLGNGTKQQVSVLTKFGKYIGIAHQIKDDILDIIGDKDKVGKEVCKDIQNGYLNYVCILAIEDDVDNFVRKINEGIVKNSLTESIKSYLVKNGYVKKAERDARKLVSMAIKLIESADLEKKKELKLLAKYIIKRKA